MESERRAAEAAISSMQLEAWVFETLPAYPESARKISIELAKNCDLFVQLVGPSVSSIVADEYLAAMEDDAGKVLVLVKDVPHDASATAHIQKIAPAHKYGKYRDAKELPRLVQESIATWISRRVGKVVHRHQRTVDVFNKTVWIWPGNNWTYWIEVEKGERIRGRVLTDNYAYTFDAFLFTEKQWTEWRNDPESWDPDEEEVITFHFDKVANRKERWYLVIVRVALLPIGTPMAVKVHVTREAKA